MPNIVIKNIPEDVISKIRVLSETDKRSMNSEILFIIDKGLNVDSVKQAESKISKEDQVNVWNKLCGKWEDDRSTKSIIKDINQSRTFGRDFDL